ncbi:MAG TPA: ROK family protein, partial [Nocardioides sp.]|nr:ROK family protein [Nocardioides sp.]
MNSVDDPGDDAAIGLDIGATKTLGVLVDGAGRVLHQVREATEPGPDGVVRTAERVVALLGAATDAAPATSVGLGIPGLVDVERGTVKHAVNLAVHGDWVPLRAELESRLGVRVVVENDVNV